MKKTLFDSEGRQQILVRLAKLRPDSKKQWGKMSVEDTLRHLIDPMRNALNEYETRSHASFLSSAIGKNLMIYVLPWPKSPPTAPEFDSEKLKDSPEKFDTGMKNLLETIERFVNIPNHFTFGVHPSFGILSKKQWGYLTYKHLNHHLSQFGL